MKKHFIKWAIRIACLFPISFACADGSQVRSNKPPTGVPGRNSQVLTITSADVLSVDGNLPVLVKKRYADDTSTLSYKIREVDNGAAFVDTDGEMVGISAGKVILTVISSGDAKYAAAKTSQLVTIRKGVPKLNIRMPADILFADTVTVDVNTTATYQRGGNVICKVVGGSGSATINANTGAFIAKTAGTVTVIATSEGDLNYDAATTSQVVTIGKRTPSLKINFRDLGEFNVDQAVSVMANTSALAGRGGSIRFSIEAGSGLATVNPFTGVVTPLEVGTATLVVATNGDANYHPAAMRHPITIGPSTPTLEIKLENKLDVGDSLTAEVVTSAARQRGGAVRFAIAAGTGDAEVDPGTGFIKALKAGTVVLKVISTGDKNYYPASVSKEFTIGQNVPQLEIVSTDRVSVGGTLLVNTISTAGAEGGKISFSIEAGSGSATIDSETGRVTAIGAGTVTLIATSDGNWNYASSSANQIINIEKGKPNLTITSASTLSVDGTLDIKVNSSATHQRGGPVRFSIVAGEGTGYAEVNANTGVLKGITAGTVLLEATSEGDTDYSAATSRQWLTIGKATPVLTIQALSKVYVDQAFGVSAKLGVPSGLGGAFQFTIESGSGSALVDPETGLINAIEAGTIYLVVSTKGDNDYYPVTVKKEVTILPSTPVLTVELSNKLDVDNTANVLVTSTATHGRGGNIQYSIVSGEGDGYAKIDPKTGLIEAITAGKVLLLVTTPGDKDYSLASTSQWITIYQNVPTLTMELPGTLSVDKTTRIKVNSTASSGLGGAVKYSAIAGSGSATVNAESGLVTALSVGTVTLEATTEGDWDYASATVKQEIVIGKSTPMLVIAPIVGLRVDDELAITVTTTTKRGGGGKLTLFVDKSVSSGYAEVDPSTGMLSAITAGKILLVATSEGDSNYNSAKTSRWITIDKATPELVILSANKLKVDETLRPRVATSATIGMGGAVTYAMVSKGSGSATLNRSTGWLTGISAGTVTLIVSTLGDSDYFPASISQDIVISPGNSSMVIVSNNNLPVDGKLPVKIVKQATGDIGVLSYTIIDGDGFATVDSEGVITGLGAGTATLVVRSAGNLNYTPLSVSQLITIKKCSPVLTIASNSWLTIGDTTKVGVTTTARDTQGGKIKFSLSAGSGSATIDPDTGLLKATGAGKVTLIASSLGDKNYLPVTSKQIITIDKMDQVLTITSPDMLAVDKSLILSASSSAGDGGISYSILKADGSAFLSGDQKVLNATHAGAVILTASSPGNDFFAAATTSQLINIEKGNPSLVMTAPVWMSVGQTGFAKVKSSATYRRGGVSNFSIEAGSGSATVDPLSGVVTAVQAGTVMLTAKTFGDDDYEGVSISQEINIIENKISVLAEKREGDRSDGVEFNSMSSDYVAEGFKSDPNASYKKSEKFQVKVPKVYSPNGDGINDKFIIENMSFYPGSKLIIQPMHGGNSYEYADYSNENPFNGKSPDGKELPDGQYLYRLWKDGKPVGDGGFFKLCRCS